MHSLYNDPWYDYPTVGLFITRSMCKFWFFTYSKLSRFIFFDKTVYNKCDANLYKSWIGLITLCSSRCTYLYLVSESSGYSEFKEFTSSKGIRSKLNVQKAPWMGEICMQLYMSSKYPL